MKTEQLISQLTQNLQPANKVLPVMVITCLWLLLSCVYVIVAMLFMAPLRPGLDLQLVFPGLFSIELISGCIAIVLWAMTAIAESVPGQYPNWPKRLAWLATGIWFAHFVVALGFPYVESAMIGKREHCAWESIIYSVPPIVLMLWLQNRRYPLEPVRAGVFAGVAGAIIPAVAMQVICMYDPVHIMQFHLAPIVYVAISTGALVYLLRRFGWFSS